MYQRMSSESRIYYITCNTVLLIEDDFDSKENEIAIYLQIVQFDDNWFGETSVWRQFVHWHGEDPWIHAAVLAAQYWKAVKQDKRKKNIWWLCK